MPAPARHPPIRYDAIVVGESIHSEAEEGRGGLDGAIIGTQLVAKPVLYAVFTTIIAFLPWLFVGGGASQFTKHISFTVIFALSFSLIEAFFILPSHLSHLKKEDKSGRLHHIQSFFADGLLGFAHSTVKPLIKLALTLRYFTVAFFIVAFMFAFALLQQGWVAFKFEPEVQGTFVSLNVRLPGEAPCCGIDGWTGRSPQQQFAAANMFCQLVGSPIFRSLCVFSRKCLDTAQSNHGGHNTHDEEYHESNLARSPGNFIQEIPDTPEDQNRGTDQQHFHPDDFFHFLTLV